MRKCSYTTRKKVVNEEWRKIPGHPNYEVSRNGYIRSNVKKSPRIMKTWPNQYGHRYIKIDGVRESIHRLVATTYIPNPNNYPVVRHLNDDPTDNRVENLAWGTQKDNRDDCVRHERDFVKAVYCYETGKTYRSCADAADELGVTRGAITMCCQGKTHACQGYHLCYLKDKDKRMDNLVEWLNHSTYKPVKAISIVTGEEIIFPSRKMASEVLRVPDCGISSVITGRINSTHGWKFEDWSDKNE